MTRRSDLDPAGGGGLRSQTSVIGSRSARSPCRPLPDPINMQLSATVHSDVWTYPNSVVFGSLQTAASLPMLDKLFAILYYVTKVVPVRIPHMRGFLMFQQACFDHKNRPKFKFSVNSTWLDLRVISLAFTDYVHNRKKNWLTLFTFNRTYS